MKDLVADCGHRVTFRKLNRDKMAESVGTTRQNLISAFKGRRPLPAAYMPPLRQALGLSEGYCFETGRVHALNADQGEKQRDLLQNLLPRFMALPVRAKWLLRGIGEGGRSGFAYVFEDSQGVLIAVRNDDALLGCSPMDAGDAVTPAGQAGWTGQAGQVVDASSMALFERGDASPEREIALEVFNALFADGMSAADLRAALNSMAKVWTWTRLREKAERAGYNAESAARALGLADDAFDGLTP